MPRPRRQLLPLSPAQSFWREVLAGGSLRLLLRLTPLTLLLPILTALIATWGVPPTHQSAAQRYVASPLTPPLPELKAALPVGAPALLGDLPPPVPRPAWLARRYHAPLLRPAPGHPRPLAFGWLGRRQLEGG